MPLFEFQCRKCSHQFEELLTTSEVESGQMKCPACRSPQVEREFSAFATSNSSAGGSRDSGGGGCKPGGFT